MDYRFQINLGGIIDLLSNHLYSGPQVYIRELLQNSVDAILARSYIEPEHQGAVNIRLFEQPAGSPPKLVFTDNGIGLTEDEIHRFLATIGQTSKRDDLDSQRSDYIGQFGIGLLSCFVVSDEIVVITRSCRDGAKTMEWRGRADGTYSIKTLDVETQAGTEVHLLCKAGSEEYFVPFAVQNLARRFGSLLPYPIMLETDAEMVQINEERPPWLEEFAGAELERAAYLDYGQRTFGIDFFDYIPLRSVAGDAQGAAFVLPFSPSLAMKKTHKVYLKNMLVSQNAEGLLPDWAFFVKCVINANGLRPTASRESFYEDEALEATRDALGRSLRDYLVTLASENPHRLRQLIALHYLSIKALAVDDDEFYRLFVDWLPFETNMGMMSLGEYRKQHEVVRYVPNLDQFRQITRIAASQSLCLINAAYTYDTQLLQKLFDVYPGTQLEAIDTTSLTYSFDYLTLDEQEEVANFIRQADNALEPFHCATEIRKFAPAELPALYSTSSDALFHRSIEMSKDVLDGLWSSVLDSLAGGLEGARDAQLCFNYNNRLIRKISRLQDETLLRLSVQMLYVQSLLLSHRPLNSKEMSLLSDGLIGLIEWGVDSSGGWVN